MTCNSSPEQFAELFRSYSGYTTSGKERQAEMLEAATSEQLAQLTDDDIAHLFSSFDPAIRLAAFRAVGRVSPT